MRVEVDEAHSGSSWRNRSAEEGFRPK
jgi:hypothetical protein